MKYIAIDASTEACSVALMINEKIHSRYELCPQSHSLVLLPMVDEVLKEANVSIQELDGLIFGRGPGSFTGVRIGIGVAQGLAFSADLPVVGVSTLQTMAQQAYQRHQEKTVLSAIDARMGEVYSGIFEADEHGIMQPLCDESVLVPELLAEHYQAYSQNIYAVGTGWDAYEKELSSLKRQEGSPEILFPNAEAMLKIGIQLLQQGKGTSAENAQPVYVRDTVSWKKLPGKE